MAALSILSSPPYMYRFNEALQFSKPKYLSIGNYAQLTERTAEISFSHSTLGCSYLDGCPAQSSLKTNGTRRLGICQSAFRSSPAMVSSVEGLYDFICEGSIVKKMGLTKEKVASNIDRWLECGVQLCRLLGLNQLVLSEAEKIRIYQYYIPVFLWCEEELSKHMSSFKDGDEISPLVIGVSAPQGSGKTTLVFVLDYLFRTSGRNSATLSIDDFYLKAEDQANLRNANPGNDLLELRGNAGSHDLAFSIEILKAVCSLNKEGKKMKLPRYDKSAFGGRGNRADPSTWPEVEGPLAVVLFEGWMLGFKLQPVEVVKAVDPQLEIINRNLEAYYDAWDSFVKSWIVIKIQDPSCVYQWRLQAEHAMKASGKPGMSDKEVQDFVSRYMPAYRAYLPTLYAEGPNGADPKHTLVVEVDEERNPIA
ncbi:D-glycerate 3-kinase, chloroplastic [Amborella trichopoda]|uniref:Phosphoribulokinase/uridine kinase domain-containing protein n=1 Tax=Amborella trichopoda TaxID=13333 RepID=W1NPQ6_AMBTC|nr:D-glycerate 3-kinase, chloroplastic [Amborella trichopoda]ERM97045.1 hypothetical protein AMTR_s00122p00077720 [Amborella trichopoda]|eukprot:XP_006829629.1 D-glycerate 3-kinase, chloroplastic [Amborella trichopoda]